MIGLVFFATSCHPTEDQEFKEPALLTEKFSYEAFAEIIPYDFRVDWDKSIKGYSEELQSEYIEFPVNWIKGQFMGWLTSMSKEKYDALIENARIAEDCYTIKTYHYTDWYQVYPDGSYVYSTSQLTDVTYETYCDGSTGTGGYGGGGGPSVGSTSGSGGSGGTYEDCDDPVHGCFYEIEDEVINLNIDDQGYSELNACEQNLVRANPLSAYKISRNISKARNKTFAIFGPYINGSGRNDCADSFRHAYFNALNAKSVEATTAKEFGDAHECDKPISLQLEKDMDLYNNSVGIYISEHKPYTSEDDLAELILNELKSGKLKYLYPLGSGNTLLPETKLVYTNQNCL